jgi:protein-S-isoprenylcysteine O-methyltransferase Ste14
MGGVSAFVYGSVAYACSLAALLYAIGFVGNLVVPKSIDVGAEAGLGEALVVNVLLLGVFAVQHSVMARRSFKAWWARVVPHSVERSTYVLAASLALGLLLWQWRPIPQPVVWRVESAAGSTLLWSVFGLGWGLLLLSTFLINHFELFGLRQVFVRLKGRHDSRTAVQDAAPLPVRAPPALPRLDPRVLVDADDDGRPPAVRDRHHGIHPARHLVRGTRPRGEVRRAVPQVSPAGRHADADPQGRVARGARGGSDNAHVALPSSRT